MTSTEIRLKAADLIEEHGWVRRKLKFRGRLCLVAAVRIAATGKIFPPPTPGSPGWEALNELRQMLAGENGSLGAWNDDPKRTRKQVLAALRRGTI